MAYHELPFQARFAQMGDKAEEAFQRYADTEDLLYERYGFNRPNLTRFRFLDPFIRQTPDYIVQVNPDLVFVDCKGTKSDTVKIKVETIAQLGKWEDYLPLFFAVYNSKRDEVSFLSFSTVKERIKFLEIQQFQNDKKEYYEVPVLWGVHLRDVLPKPTFGTKTKRGFTGKMSKPQLEVSF